MKAIPSKVFKFDDSEIKMHIQYEMKLFSRMNKSFDYVSEKLKTLGFYKDFKGKLDKIKLERLKWDEGKSYKWIYLVNKNTHLLVRSYGTHHTVFTKLIESKTFSGHIFDESSYGAFTFYTETKNLPGEKHDYYIDCPFHDLNTALTDIFRHIEEDLLHLLWNSHSLIRPDYCEVKNVYDHNSASSIDSLIFCADELSNQHMGLYAQNDMLETLKQLGDCTGQPFNNRETIVEIVTEFSKDYSEPYYHAVGIKTIDDKNETRFHDVYSLSRYYLDEVDKLTK